MSKLKYAHYMKLTANELHIALTKRKLPLEMVNYIKDVVSQQKADLRVRKIKRAAHRKVWGALLKPLDTEIRATRGSLSYKGAQNDARSEAFAAYETVLLKVSRKLRTIRNSFDLTPSEAAVESDIPNKGEHWSDWVPLGKRVHVANLFDAIPHKARAKRKVPFERNIPVETLTSKLTHQRAIYEGRLQGMEQMLLIYKDDERYQRMGHVKETQDKIDALREKVRDLNRQLDSLNERPTKG